eukprot:5123195-Pleurochrysis_carterae.AAC.1
MHERLAHRADGHSENLLAVCEQNATAEAKVDATTTMQMASIVVDRAEHAQTFSNDRRKAICCVSLRCNYE